MQEAVGGDADGSALEQFMDTIAHEVRTPLAIAKMAAATVVSNRLCPEERDRLLAIVLRNTDLALLLLDRVGLARDVETDTVLLSVEELDLAVLVRESIGDLRTAILSDHPIETLGSTSAPVAADATALREILFNLLLNAAKYSPPDTPIEVTLGEVAGQITLIVADHGHGVAAADRERIFDKYVQMGEGGGGVGLGLFISRGLARAHGGDLIARAGAVDGSEFVLLLPRRPTPPDGPSGQPVTATMPRGGKASGTASEGAFEGADTEPGGGLDATRPAS